jgi:amino-acid N-acetyltransferase
MKIEKLQPEQMPEAMNLLQKNNLPVEDLNGDTMLFGTYEDGELIGIAGIELYGEDALIRSVCVDEAYRSKGMAEILTGHIEQYAKRKGACTLYLLTTTAENYFKRKGFVKVDRDDVPQTIKQSSEFSSVCPSSAVVLKKELS